MADQQQFFPSDQDPAALRHDARLLALASRLPARLKMGTSSWAFPGWAGLVYDRPHRAQLLSQRGLSAYAKHPLFSTVSLDRTYYAPMAQEDLARYAQQVPDDFSFQPKGWNALTLPVDKGRENPDFLNPKLANEAVLSPLMQGLGAKLGPVVWQFSPLALGRVGGVSGFLTRLDQFLQGLQPGLVQAIEVRNSQLCSPQLAQVLARHGARYVLNLLPGMPSLDEQFKQMRLRDTPELIVRWLLAPGWEYATAKASFSPFSELACPDLHTRQRLAAMIRWADQAHKGVRLTVNNKAEGCAPLSIEQLALELADA